MSNKKITIAIGSKITDYRQVVTFGYSSYYFSFEWGSDPMFCELDLTEAKAIRDLLSIAIKDIENENKASTSDNLDLTQPILDKKEDR